MSTKETPTAPTLAQLTGEHTALMLENDVIESNIAKLYLNERTSDVCFVFDADKSDGQAPERIRAHKVVLAAGSNVFDAMFFGPLKENAEVKIVDASAAAFKEFLQLFYRRQMQLTLENVGEVVNLCRKYQLVDALPACEQRIKEKLNISNMCWGYSFAKNLDFPDLRRFCESKIHQFTPEILQSTSFLDCSRDDVADILKSLSINNYSPKIVDAYMNWAKVQCARVNLEPNAANLRARLGDDLIKTIPFNRISMDHFVEHTQAYREFFTHDEFEAILKDVSNRIEKVQRQSGGNFMDCDRRIESTSLVSLDHSKPFVTVFVASKSVALTEVFASLLRYCSCSTHLNIKYSIYKMGSIRGILLRGEMPLARQMTEIHIVAPEPIPIAHDQRYEIVLRIEQSCGHDLYTYALQNTVQMSDAHESDTDDDGDRSSSCIAVKFENIYRKPNANANDCVTRLKFNHLED